VYLPLVLVMNNNAKLPSPVPPGAREGSSALAMEEEVAVQFGALLLTAPSQVH